MRRAFCSRSVSFITSLGLTVGFSLVWSSAFMAGKVGLAYADPYTVLTLRFVLAAALLAPVCLPSLRQTLRTNPMLLRDALVLGVLNNVLYLALSFSALRFISAELVVIMVSCTPFLVSMFGFILGLERVGARGLLGIVIGFVGVLVITLTKPVGAIAAQGLILAIVATAAFAAATVFYKNKAALHAPQQVNFLQSVIAAVVLSPLALIQISTKTPEFSLIFCISIAWLAIVVTIAGMWLWLYLIRRYGAAIASSCHLANPFCGLLLSNLIFGTKIRVADWIGVVVIVVGLLVLINPTGGEKHAVRQT